MKRAQGNNQPDPFWIVLISELTRFISLPFWSSMLCVVSGGRGFFALPEGMASPTRVASVACEPEIGMVLSSESLLPSSIDGAELRVVGDVRAVLAFVLLSLEASRGDVFDLARWLFTRMRRECSKMS